MVTLSTLFESLTPADWVDLVCALIVLVGMIQGAFRGFSGEISRLLALLAALAAAFWLRAPLGRILAAHTRLAETPGEAQLVVFVLVFLAALLAALLLRRLLGRFVRLVVTPTTDLLLGILAGGTRMAIVLLVVLAAWSWLPASDSRTLVLYHARTGRLLAPLVDAANRRIETTPALAEPLQHWAGREEADRLGNGAADPETEQDAMPTPQPASP